MRASRRTRCTRAITPAAARELTLARRAAAAGGTRFALGPGEALFVPVMAPHFVRNGPEPSVSLSITWRSEWSFAEADARGFNGLLRRIGLNPRAPAAGPRATWPRPMAGAC